jgi:hypothetical protein
MTAIFFSPKIGPIAIDCWISERHSSTIGITEIAVESGAKITDHAYVQPKKLDVDFGSKTAAVTYQALMRFQKERKPFTVVSGLNVYTNMLIRDISAQRNAEYSQVLSGSVSLQEIIIVKTGTTADKAAPKAKDDDTKDKTDGTVTRGDQPSTEAPGGGSVLHEIIFGSGGKQQGAGLTGPAGGEAPT